ncbi:hypothetical protein B0H13DRAFT_1912862 [Mycena leptocephala]|nr:hypothetical protein B0H13DRAFT_1912862 [Mycena leptocephala]
MAKNKKKNKKNLKTPAEVFTIDSTMTCDKCGMVVKVGLAGQHNLDQHKKFKCTGPDTSRKIDEIFVRKPMPRLVISRLHISVSLKTSTDNDTPTGPLLKFCDKLKCARARQIIESEDEFESEHEHPTQSSQIPADNISEIPKSSGSPSPTPNHGDNPEASEFVTADVTALEVEPEVPQRRVRRKRYAATCDGCGEHVKEEDKGNDELVVECAQARCETRWYHRECMAPEGLALPKNWICEVCQAERVNKRRR